MLSTDLIIEDKLNDCLAYTQKAISLLNEMDKKQKEAIELLVDVRDILWYLERAINEK